MIQVNGTILTAMLALALAVSQTGCGNQTGDSPHGHPHPSDPDERPARVAVAELQPTEGNEAHGTVTFTQVEGGIRVVAEIQGMSGGPGERGFHIHEHGDCSAPDGTSAGGHFNPTDMPHGAPDDEERHAGDFGNLTIDENGVGHADFVDTHISFTGPTSIIGRAVIVHAAPDDLVSQPTGDAGPRAACGVIQVTEYDE